MILNVIVALSVKRYCLVSMCLSVCLSRAADEYILRHFDKYVCHQSGTDVSVLRVYDPERRSSTVNQTVKQYCLMSSDAAAAASFVSPTRSDVVRHNIVVTTLVTSLLLTKLGVKGHFTHIFIDEAAQVRLLTYFLYYYLWLCV